MGLGLGWLGDKGISRVGKVTTLGTKTEQSISHFSNKLQMRAPLLMLVILEMFQKLLLIL